MPEKGYQGSIAFVYALVKLWFRWQWTGSSRLNGPTIRDPDEETG